MTKRFFTLILTILLIFSMVACSNQQEEHADQNNQNGSQLQESNTEKNNDDKSAASTIELGDELSSFTISIQGTVFQFPCSLADVQAAGWEADSGAISRGVYTNMEEPGREKTLLTFYYKGDRSLNVDFIFSNVSDQSMPRNECPIVGVYNNGAEGIEWILPGDFNVVPGTTTKEDVIAKYGGSGVAYIFGDDKYFEFSAYSKVYKFMQCVNIPDSWGE